MVATYNFGSVYTCVGTYIRKFIIRKCLREYFIQDKQTF